MCCMRVTVPPKLQLQVLEELHSAHSGIVKMKELARSYFWWPKLDSHIEDLVKSCEECQQIQKMPGPAPLHPWSSPDAPWKRLHIDFAGPFHGHMYLVVVDSHSKWPEVFIMKATTAEKTNEILRGLFCRYGLLLQIVSDNGPQFVSAEFKYFLEMNEVQHILSAPYHPATNGLAERFVQTFKHALRKLKSADNLQQKLSAFLLTYRNTSHSTTSESPAMLLLGRRLCSRLDLLKPKLAVTVQKRQHGQISAREGRRKQRSFSVNQPVYVRNYREGSKWVTGSVVAKTGPVSYQVAISPNMIWKRHVDQLVTRSPSDSVDVVHSRGVVLCSDDHHSVISESKDDTSDVQCRYPVRSDRKPPIRLDL
ncbi:uncharacterized protein K02A2.6-like isoform X1 [Gigantopelta aegis]|uniref:uncharacterized protein K02A2.6-like isoform X1 n=1 Tax=Gigantopelta aegis TaxID=1735272 RepID=UPI001B88A699|nr:uncharacterized protein K02A2.6-like isoform X1 [Gigantopelta aegis]XP_041353243.1 uncharacterized protein K02A2.6-like isoform X1 [Gigantopelta aegis]XP_041353244.1 uncharacterized protein K02A2.6-like isoform X1 [Gigantopelta aegis]